MILFIPQRSLRKTQLEQGEKKVTEVTHKGKQNELPNSLVVSKQLFTYTIFYLLVITGSIRSVEVTCP